MMNIDFVDYDSDFLSKSWEWLNDYEIATLTSTPSFTKEQQLRWFKGLQDKQDYFIKGICVNKIRVGAVGLKKITETDCEYWGYIGDKNFWGQGVGTKMLDFAILEAQNRNIHYIYLHVCSNNIRAIGLYKKFNFAINISKSTEQNYYMSRKIFL